LEGNIQTNLKEVVQASSAKNMLQYLPGPSEVSIENYMDKSQALHQLRYYQLLHQADIDASSIECHYTPDSENAVVYIV